MRLPFLDKYRQMFASFATPEVVRYNSLKITNKTAELFTAKELVASTSPGICDTEYVKGRRLIVSLTTFSTRIEWVALAIESIMDQTAKPNRIILWLGHEFEAPDMIPLTLLGLRSRGLEIRFTDDIGPATKLIPALREFPNDLIVTIDDDTIYSCMHLDRLLQAHMRHPEAVITDWADNIGFNPEGKLEYSIVQARAGGGGPDMKPVALGVSGVLYPPGCMHPDVADTARMLDLAPHADDLWFKTMQLRAGTPVYCINTTMPYGDRVYDMGHNDPSVNLYTQNQLGKGNDRQLEKLLANYPDAFDVYK